MKEYTDDGNDWNKSLREDSAYAEKVYPVNELDSLISRQVAPEDITVYRGIGSNFSKQLKEGMIFVDNGYTSTTLDVDFVKEAWGSKFFLRIQIPQGKNLYYAGPRSLFPEQYEAILPRGTKFQVISVDQKNFSAVLKVVQ